jgi:hypothetical protein
MQPQDGIRAHFSCFNEIRATIDVFKTDEEFTLSRWPDGGIQDPNSFSEFCIQGLDEDPIKKVLDPML